MAELRETMIAKLRADFVVVADARRASGDWTEADEKEIALAIKSSVDSGNPESLTFWALYFSDLAHTLTTCALLVRIAEGRIRAQIARDREERAEADRKKREGSRK